MTKKQKAELVYDILSKKYPDATCSLEFKDPLQLLVATQLAAQCTDKRVNMVTPGLFEKLQTAWDFASVDILVLEGLVRSTGFYKNKAKNIKEACRVIFEKFDSQVPSDMDELLSLPGVGRKTANVVRGEVFGLPGIVVDTHAGRLSRRIGLTKHEDPVKVEYDLMKLLNQAKWNNFCHLLIEHGRETCTSRSPKCQKCSISNICTFVK